jgi:hypothetical protein
MEFLDTNSTKGLGLLLSAIHSLERKSKGRIPDKKPESDKTRVYDHKNVIQEFLLCYRLSSPEPPVKMYDWSIPSDSICINGLWFVSGLSFTETMFS